MKCSEIDQDLSIYADGMTGYAMADSIAAHLKVCPLCRQKNSEYLELRADLRSLKRPELSLAFRSDLKRSLRGQERVVSAPNSTKALGEWFQMRFMPYVVGVITSAVIGFGFLGTLQSGLLRPAPVETVRDARSEPVILAKNYTPEERRSMVSPIDFVNSRSAFASESPSINPEGALLAVTRSMFRGKMKDEEVVVVAEVFSNGLARITDVVESPDDRLTVDELDRAFRSNSASTPFVPAVMENRPENMRIVLKFQSVDVETNPRPKRTRL